MRKIIVFLACLISLVGEIPHPAIPAKYLIEKNSNPIDIYLSDWIEIENNEICFRDPMDFGIDSDLEIYFRDKISGKEEGIAKFHRGAEVLSVFFKDMSLDGLRDIFILTKYKGKYKIYSYGIAYYMSNYYYERNEDLDSFLNKKFENYQGELNAGIIKKEIGDKLLVDYMGVYFNSEKNIIMAKN